MASPSPSSSRIPPESITNAVDALLNWIRAQPKHQKSQLFEPDDVLYLILTLTRIPSKGRTNPYRIPIPHPIHPFDPQLTSICLILDDRPSSPLLPAAAVDQIRARNLPIPSVIGLSDLKSDYRPYESRRKLCDSYDLFFADRKILPLLPRLLGKHFFKRKKIPLAIDSSRAGWAEQIKSWCEASLMYLRTGTCVGLKIGRVTQSTDEIVENAVAVIEKAMEIVPKKWGNLRSVHVKTVESLALPVYQAVPEIGMKIEGVWDEKGESFGKGKKRARGSSEEKKGKKGKKGRIHDAGVFDGDDGEVVGQESGEEDGRLMLTDDDDGGILYGIEEVSAEMEKGTKKGKKGLKSKKAKRGDNEDEDGEQNAGGVTSVKKNKKKLEAVAAVVAEESEKIETKVDEVDDGEGVNTELGMMETKAKKGGKVKMGKVEGNEMRRKELEAVAVIAADESEKSGTKKKKKKGVDDVISTDDGEGVNAESGIVEKKVQNGGKAKKAKGEGNVKSKKKSEMVAVIDADESDKSGTKNKRGADDVIPNDDEGEEANVASVIVVKKVKKGGTANQAKGEGNEKMTKKKKVEKAAVVTSDGTKKSKTKRQRIEG